MQELIASLPSLMFAQLQGLENGQDVLFDRHFAKNRLFLWQIPHPKPSPFEHREISDVGVPENHVATIWSDESHDHVKRCGLAGAVWPQQSNDFSAADIYIDT